MTRPLIIGQVTISKSSNNAVFEICDVNTSRLLAIATSYRQALALAQIANSN